MAQRSASMLVLGKVKKWRRVAGSFDSRETPGEKIAYDYIEARVVTPEVDVVEVRFPVDGSIPVPPPEKLVVLRVDVRGSGANVKASVEAVLTLADLASLDVEDAA